MRLLYAAPNGPETVLTGKRLNRAETSHLPAALHECDDSDIGILGLGTGEGDYTGCNRRNGPDFGRVFLMLNYTEKPQKHLYPKLNGLGDNGQ